MHRGPLRLYYYGGDFSTEPAPCVTAAHTALVHSLCGWVVSDREIIELEGLIPMEQELAGKVAIITGAGRMRSIGRPIAKLLAQAGAAIVITGTGRPPEHYPDDEKAAGWHDIESVAGEIRGAGGRCLTLISDVCDE